MDKKEHIISHSVSTSEKVLFLKDPRNYAEHPDLIETIETHMSYLFLTKNRVYKMKKPVKLNSIDFSTLEARELNCREEFRINKELAKGVYLDILRLNTDESGNLHWDGKGKVVDWLVKMKRLKEEHLLHKLIQSGNIDPAMLKKTAIKLADFYHTRPEVPFEASEYLNRLKAKITKNHLELQDPEFELPAKRLQSLYAKQLEFLEMHPDLFTARVKAGKIIEAHGDLKPEHICLEKEPLIIDRLEFDQDLRILDPAEELAFLAVECELLKSPETGTVFYKQYEQVTQDKIPEKLVHFYKSKQASLRAKFAIWHVKEARYKLDPKWKERALEYLEVSKNYMNLLKTSSN